MGTVFLCQTNFDIKYKITHKILIRAVIKMIKIMIYVAIDLKKIMIYVKCVYIKTMICVYFA